MTKNSKWQDKKDYLPDQTKAILTIKRMHDKVLSQILTIMRNKDLGNRQVANWWNENLNRVKNYLN